MQRKALAGATLAAVLLTAACGGGTSAGGPSASASAPTDPAKATGEITVLTNRTDMVTDGTLAKYAAEFNKTHPGITVKFDGITDYEGEVKIRMNTENYGDVLLIPSTVSRDDYPKFFSSLGPAAELSKKYQFTEKGTVDGTVYGLTSFGVVNGFVYNKDLWAKAGVTEWPKTPAEFLTALQAVKDKTGAIPYYTNYKDGWPLSGWQGAMGAITCDPKANDKLATSRDPWAAGSDLNVSDTLLFDIVSRKLSEPDPTTTNWEDSKSLLANGKISSMFLGSWSIVQMRAAAEKAGKSPDSIGYMPFPAQVNGKFCAPTTPDYVYAINKHSQNQQAARAWLDWVLDKSTFAADVQGISSVRGAPLPTALKPFEAAGVEFFELSQADSGKVTTIDNAAEVGLTKPEYRQKLVDIARGAAKGDLAGAFRELAGKWAEAMALGG
ncbi:ABC transporter substrate-binding protein [Nonomuraea candida]|uniref:ABC transporter substrate-binding protein n=1 Tax=Nonomuraea candida TaxID=359159 RepID=UPI0005BE9A20|nr:extracellular solute-binding protein [Nonomuraea candida]